jgi:hypothetical protein
MESVAISTDRVLRKRKISVTSSGDYGGGNDCCGGSGGGSRKGLHGWCTTSCGTAGGAKRSGVLLKTEKMVPFLQFSW